MAYMSQEHKKEIAAALKKVMPPGWKYSLAVDNYSTIVLRIAAAPVDLISENLSPASHKDHRYIQLNPYYLEKEYSGETLKVFEAIKAVLYKGNHNHSDIMSDYHDVGWYVDIHVGRWDKPFMYVPSGDRRIKAAREDVMYRDQETTPYGAPLTEVELEDLRCLIGSHFFKDIGNEDGRGQCVNCGVKEGD